MVKIYKPEDVGLNSVNALLGNCCLHLSNYGYHEAKALGAWNFWCSFWPLQTFYHPCHYQPKLHTFLHRRHSLHSSTMDYQNRAGSKFGGGGVASHSATNADRRERLRKLALETIDLDKDPYFFKNHVGSFECRLCLTVHQNDGSYLAHTQGRKHQTNLARRAAREQKEQKDGMAMMPGMMGVAVRKNVVKIGRPGYKITKTRDPLTRQVGLLFQLLYPEIGPGVEPRVRFMSAFEQKVDDPPDKAFQYLLVAAEPYETCGFKLQAREVDRREGRFWTWWDGDSRDFWIQVMFKTERDERYSNVPGLAPGPLRR